MVFAGAAIGVTGERGDPTTTVYRLASGQKIEDAVKNSLGSASSIPAGWWRRGPEEALPKDAAYATGSSDPRLGRNLACLFLQVTIPFAHGLWCLLLLALANIEPVAAQGAQATVRLDGAEVLVVSGDTRSQARRRADEIELRLNRMLDAAAPVTSVTVARTNDGARILTVGGRTIVQATNEDATDAGLTLEALTLQWQRAIEGALTGARERRMTRWGRFVAQTQASINNAFARLYESAILVIPRLIAGTVVLLLFWAVAALVRSLMRIIFRRIISDLTVENLIRQVAYYTVWAIGLIVATSALGFDPQALATGLGLTGVALGFALKDILSNFVAGLLILAMRPFEIGDQIVVGETEGAVEGINLRATRVRTYDGRAVLVPNGEVFTSRITNNTESPVRRGSIEVPVDYRTNLASLGAMLIEEVRRADGVLPDPPPSVRVRNLGQDDIVVEVRFWTDSRRSDFVATASNVREKVVSVMQQAKIDLPDPSLRILERRSDSAAPRGHASISGRTRE